MAYIDKFYKDKILSKDFLQEVCTKIIYSEIFMEVSELNDKYEIKNGNSKIT
jgi:uncharacterized membrane protein YjfL (UPF0719 family)